MKNTSKTIIFFGTDAFSLTTLSNLVGSGYDIAAIVTKPDSRSGRGHQVEVSAVKGYATRNNIEVWQPEIISEINSRIANIKTDVVGVLVSYGKIIPATTIDLFKPGIINIHPSLLPKYRGPSPIESVIKNGDKLTGVSIMRLTPEMDAGPVYGQIVHELSGNETRIELRKTLAQAGAMALITLLPNILDGSIQPVTQNDADASYSKLLTKSDAVLIPDGISAIDAERQVRAYLGFPKTKLNLLGHDVVIIKAHVSDSQNTPLDIACKDGRYLSIDELIAPSGNAVTSREFINGYSH
jgi:methionyl-tRNA formyltransferase